MRRTLLFFALLSLVTTSFAQRKVRQAVREGNSLYHKEDYLNAEIQYRTALDGNAADSLAMYNLGNSLFRQQQDEKAQEALRHYTNAAQMAQKGGDRQLAAKAFYNAGDICMAAQQYQQAVQYFKRALRNDPLDDEARYNLFLAQKLLDQQQQNQDRQNKKDSQQQDQNQQQQQDQQKQDESDQQQDQDPNQQENQDQKDEQDQSGEEKEEDQELEATLKKAQERNDEHEAEKKARMRKQPLPPNERDW